MITSDPTAFDAFAVDYDKRFTRSRLGRLLRARVWAKLAVCFSKGQHLLELACGTGEDAVWLAKQGLTVTATDGSAAMIRLTRTKAESAGVSDRIKARQLSMQDLMRDRTVLKSAGLPAEQRESGFQFDGLYSNFGGLNAIADRRLLARSLSELVKPRGIALFVVMGPLCPWEIAWYLGHGQPKTALRRYQPASAKVGASNIPIWYPSPKVLAAEFGPWFRHCQTASLGFWLPPSYLDHFVERWPGLFTRLDQLEHAMAGLTRGWGDHYIIILQRRG